MLMEKLVVKPFGGLANRLFAIDSAIKLREQLNPVQTLIIWERNEALNCKFTDIFEVPKGIEIKETVGFDKFNLQSYQEIYNSFNPNHYRWSWFNKIMGKERQMERLYYAKEIERLLESDKVFQSKPSKSLYLSYFGRFTETRGKLYRFQPKAEIGQQVEEMMDEFKGKPIGIHIRRSDHQLSIQNSPTSLFMKKIDEQYGNSEYQLFLSTDSQEEKQLLKKKYGDRLMTRDINFSRNDKFGVIDAVIDLYCLSRTQKIFGSHESTFSQLASELGDIDLQIVKT